MARGVNIVILLGNLGHDPDLRYTPQGRAISRFTLATTARRTDPQTGTASEHTEWHRVVATDQLAQETGQILSKGCKAYIEGRLHYRKWKDRNGKAQQRVEIVAHKVQRLDDDALPDQA